MNPSPLGKVLNEDNMTSSKEEDSSRSEKKISSKLGRKEIHQGGIRFWESIKLWEKKKAIKLEKTSTKKKREKWMQEFSSFFEKIIIHQKTWKIIQVERDEQIWRLIKRRKSNQIEEDEEKKRRRRRHIS